MEQRIAVSPTVHFGKPCVKGTRIPVHRVLELVEEGVPFEEITSQQYYPALAIDDVRACVSYARRLVEQEDVFPELILTQ